MRNQLRGLNERESDIEKSNPQGVRRPDMLTGIVHGLGMSMRKFSVAGGGVVGGVVSGVIKPQGLRPRLAKGRAGLRKTQHGAL